MKELIMPDTKRLQSEYLVNYGKEFLRLNNLNVGDEIELAFDYEVTKTRYKSRELDKYTFQKNAKGILKLDDNGFLFAESLENMQFYEYTKDFRRYYYKSVMKKSIKRFGTGFIY